jgi:general secretion pathway protein D
MTFTLTRPSPSSDGRLLLAASLLLLGSAVLAQTASPGAAAPSAASPSRTSTRAEPVTLNFVNADIDAVARTMATITGRNVVVDPRVKGVLTLITEKPVAPLAAFNQFAAQLRLQGLAVVEASGLYKVVPEADAKLQGGAVSARRTPGGANGGNQIATQIFRLNHESANSVLPALRPLISPNNSITVNPGNNSLIITDYADNLQRMASIIAALDVPNASGLEIISLKNALATDLVPLMVRLLDGGSGGAGAGAGAQGDTSFRTTLLAEPRGNALILRAANPARVALVRSLVERLDRPPEEGANASGNIHVVYLKNADATQLAITLRGAMAAEAGPSTTTPSVPLLAPPGGLLPGAAPVQQPAGLPGGATGTSAPRPASTGGQIQADVATNSLIITAPAPQYRQLRAVIDRLDARRAQVYVESLIAEVNADKAAEFGIQWQGPLGNAGNSLIGLLGTNFGAGGNNILNLSTQGLAGVTLGGVQPGAGLNAGILQRNNGVYALGFLARLLEQTGSGNILSTPNLLTMDNEEAKIVIGQNVPFITGRYTNTGTGNNGTVNPFQTIERRDVGLTLRVRPQISENGSVKLVIAQEVSSVQASSVNSASGIITNKRSIDSTVMVQDGGIVVLGGLLQDEYADNQEKVPLLGDVPFFGNLFKSQSRSRKKTNLMVFMRPVVMREASGTDSLTMDRYDLMRNQQQMAQPLPNPMLGLQSGPMLPNQDRLPRPATGGIPAYEIPVETPVLPWPTTPSPTPAPSPAPDTGPGAPPALPAPSRQGP